MKANETCGFYGMVYFDELEDKDVETLEDLFDEAGLEADISSTLLEFDIESLELAEYKKLISTMKKVAKIVKEGDGELGCEITSDDEDVPDPHFEFYTIKEGKLWQQGGKIVRDKTPKAL